MTYKVPDLPNGIWQAETIVKRSRFIVSIGKAESPEAARHFIEAVRRAMPGATHNCWAFQCGAPGSTAQVGASDDGEPHGTAGRPMLTTLLHSGVGDIVAVVTRYYGGILLGTGGLVRAYSGAVKEGLDTLPTTEKKDAARVLVSVDIALADAVRREIERLSGVITSSEFDFDAAFEVEIDATQIEVLEGTIDRLTQGDGLVELLEGDD